MNPNKKTPPVRMTAEAVRIVDQIVTSMEQAGKAASRTSVVSDLVLSVTRFSVCGFCQAKFVVIKNGNRDEPEYCPDCGFSIPLPAAQGGETHNPEGRISL
jgi:hypothetical protein